MPPLVCVSYLVDFNRHWYKGPVDFVLAGQTPWKRPDPVV